MTRSRKLAAAAAGLALTMPGVTLAQDAPVAPEISDEAYEVQTGTRIQHVVVIGAMRDRSAPARAERPADRRVPELPVTYEDAPARPGQ